MINLPDHAKMVFKGIRCEIYQWEQELFDGTPTTFEKILRYPSVTVFALTEEGKIIMQLQEQPMKEAPFLCLTGGIVDEGEEPLEGAKRELLEETGYASDDWELWQISGMRGNLHWENHVFIARNCRKVAEMKLDAGEKIELRFVSLDDFLETAADPTFRHKDLLADLTEMRYDPQRKNDFKKLLGL